MKILSFLAGGLLTLAAVSAHLNLAHVFRIHPHHHDLHSKGSGREAEVDRTDRCRRASDCLCADARARLIHPLVEGSEHR